MKIIPVIDLKDGQVVAARHGLRDNYQPVKSTLCDTSSIENVINGFLAIYCFSTIYIADLNAISQTGNNQTLIETIVSKYQHIEFWIDNGKTVQSLSLNIALNYKQVIGSESQDPSNFQDNSYSLEPHILSLDFFPIQGYVGPAELIENSSSWPKDIIIMTLERVGKNAGPDIKQLHYFCQKHPNKNIIAAGGIRNITDLINLTKIGVHHALIASALHSGHINTQAIKKLIS